MPFTFVHDHGNRLVYIQCFGHKLDLTKQCRHIYIVLNFYTRGIYPTFICLISFTPKSKQGLAVFEHRFKDFPLKYFHLHRKGPFSIHQKLVQ